MTIYLLLIPLVLCILGVAVYVPLALLNIWTCIEHKRGKKRGKYTNHKNPEDHPEMS